jgi:hypothetical protein
MHGDGTEGRLQGVRSSVRTMVKASVIDTAPNTILPVALTFETSTERLVEAENHARALRRCTRIAGPLGLGGTVDATLRTIGEKLEERTETMLAGLMATARTGEDVDQARAQLFGAARLLELVGGSNQADQMLIRGRAALDSLG